MRLSYSEYDINFEIMENRVNVFVIENPKIMTEILRELYNQNAGMEGKFVISENNKILEFDKKIYLISNLFQLEFNDKKILNRLYQNLEELAVENLISEEIKINGNITDFLNQICELSPYNLEFKTQFLPIDLMKMGGIRFVKEPGNLLEDIIQYIDIINKLVSPKLIIFFNLKLYLSEIELQHLYEFVFYHKISILLIEGNQYEKIAKEDIFIIDKDQCTIRI